MKEDISIAIIGFGPKGLYCLERLVAELSANPSDRTVRIHIINKNENFGVSPIYDINQPEYILLNISVEEINVWSESHPSPVVCNAQRFVDWYNDKYISDRPITGEEYLSRAKVGIYLNDCFELIRRDMPDGIELVCHVGEAVDLDQKENGYQIEIIDSSNNSSLIDANKIMLATGHSQKQLGSDDKVYQDFASTHPDLRFVPFTYPVVSKLSSIGKDDRVAIKGIGLTFIDSVLELTEGRGGRFSKDAHGVVEYIKSGSEPDIVYPFSRTGLPVIPKSQNLPQDLRKLVFCSEEKLAVLQNNILGRGRKLDYEKDIFPLVMYEMKRAYYLVCMHEGDWRSKLIECDDDGDAMEKVIVEYLSKHPEVKPMDYESAIKPLSGKSFDSGESYNTFIAQYLENEIDRSYRGQTGSATKAATEIWFEIRYALSSVIQFGGLSPESHERIINYHFSLLKRIVFGPTVINSEKILALIKAGIIDFSIAINPRLRVNEATECFEFHCEETSTEIVSTNVLLDARFPSVRLSEDASKLITNLCRKGIIRMHKNIGIKNPESSYCSGAIDMTPVSQNVIEDSGNINPDISVIGIPTEYNIVGNLSLSPGKYPSIWAKQIIEYMNAEEI